MMTKKVLSARQNNRSTAQTTSRKRATLLRSGASMAALMIAAASLVSAPAFAAPSITYTGSVTPAPEQGVTNWTTDATVTIGDADGNSGTLSITGGAKVTGPVSGSGQFTILHNGGMNIDGIGSEYNTATSFSTGTVEIETNSFVNVKNGAVLTGDGLYTNLKSSKNKQETTINIFGYGSRIEMVSAFQGNRSRGLGVTDLFILNGGQLYVKKININVIDFSENINVYDEATAPRASTIMVSGAGSMMVAGVGGAGGIQLLNTTMTVADGGEVQAKTTELNQRSTVNIGGGVGDAPTAVAGSLGDLNLKQSTSVVNFNHTGDYQIGGITGYSGVINQINGTTIVTGAIVSAASGAALNISGGTLQLGDGGTTGGDGLNAATVNNGTLAVNRSNNITLASAISGTGKVQNDGAGTLTLTGANTYSGGTYFNAGTIAVKSASVLGAAGGELHFNGGTLQNTDDVAHSGAVIADAGGAIFSTDLNKLLTLQGALSGTGVITKKGAGTLELDTTGTGNTGGLTVSEGILVLNGTVGGGAAVASGATLTGMGTIKGNTTIAGGATLAGNSGQTLSFDGDLTLDSASIVSATMSALSNTLFEVSGHATLAGTLNVNANAGFGGRVYTVFYADGGITDSGLTIGTVTGGNLTGDDVHKVIDGNSFSIVNAADDTTIYWNGDGSATAGHVGGGGGTWDNTTSNWTKYDGTGATSWANNDFAVFSGTAGTVAAGGIHLVSNIQFVTDGYIVNGGIIDLTSTTNDKPIINVGTGISRSKDLTATIGSVLAGTKGLNKTDYGTLVLTGTNTYTGGTDVTQGTLQLGNGGATGLILGNVAVSAYATLAFNRSAAFDFDGVISGDGLVVQKGAGTVTLSGANTFKGELDVESGTVKAGSASAFGTGILDVSSGGTADLNGNDITLASVSGAGTVTLGDKTLTITAGGGQEFAGVMTGDTGSSVNVTGDWIVSGDVTADTVTVNNGLQIGNGGATGTVTAAQGIALSGADAKLIFDRNDSYTLASAITGTDGKVVQAGAGTTILTGASSYTSDILIANGTLQIGDGTLTTASFGTTSAIENNSKLVYNLASGGDLIMSGVVSGTGMVEKNGDGTLTLQVDNSFAKGLKVNGGTVKAGSSTAFGTGVLTADNGTVELNGFDVSVAALAGSDGHIDLGAKTLTLNGGTGDYSGAITGTGGLTIGENATQILSGSGKNDYSGATLVSGVLQQGAANAFSAQSDTTIAQDSTLDLDSYDATLKSLSNSGMVYFGRSGDYATLTVSGNYSSNDGAMLMRTALGDDNSQTDMLIVAGDTSGTTVLNIANKNGKGAATIDGIKVVSVGGQSDGTFMLKGNYTTKDGQQAILGGAYGYTLHQGTSSNPSDGNWYLTSMIADLPCQDTGTCPPTKPRYGPSVPVYEGYMATMQALNKLPTLQQRVGNRYLDTAANGKEKNRGETANSAIWGRIEGAHNRLEPDTTAGRLKQSINSFILQAGVDGQFYEDENGKLIAGFTGQYGNAHSDITNQFGDGKINTQGWGLGATATWYGNSGFYADGQAQANWYDSDLDSETLNSGLARSKKGFGYALSMEAGQRISIDQNWALTPQAQLMWSSINFDSFSDNYGVNVSDRDGNSLTARMGLAASYARNWTGADGLAVNTSFYGIANLYQDLVSDAKINIAGVNFDTDNDRTWAGVGAGGTYAWANSKYALYGEGSVNTSLNHFANSYALKGTVGFKMSW